MTTQSPHRPVLLVGLLSALSFVCYALRTNISIAQEFMMPELGLSPEDMGTISAWGFQLAYALFQIPAGFLGDRYGSRKVLTWAVVGWALATVGTGLVPATAGAGLAFASLFAMRFALGVAQAATYPVGVLAVSQAVDPLRRGAANGIFIGSALVGAAATPPLIAWTMVTLGWRAAFFASGALALVIAVVWFVFTPLKAAAGANRLLRTTPPLGEQIRAAARLLRDRSLLLLCLSYAAHSAVFFVFVFWFFRYLTDARGFSVLKGGMFGAAPYLVAAVVGPTGGWLLDRLSRRYTPKIGRRAVAMGGLLLAALCVGLGATAEDPYLAIAALSLSVGFLNAVENPFWITATHLGADHAGAAGGVLNFMGNMGGVVSIWAVPRMVTAWGWTPTLATWAGVAVVSALLWLSFSPVRPSLESAAGASESPRSPATGPSRS